MGYGMLHRDACAAALGGLLTPFCAYSLPASTSHKDGKNLMFTAGLQPESQLCKRIGRHCTLLQTHRPLFAGGALSL